MENLTLEKLKRLESLSGVRTRCGSNEVLKIGETGDKEFPICAVVLEVVTEGRGRRRKTRKDNTVVLYHADGRIYDDKDDDLDLMIEGGM